MNYIGNNCFKDKYNQRLNFSLSFKQGCWKENPMIFCFNKYIIIKISRIAVKSTKITSFSFRMDLNSRQI